MDNEMTLKELKDKVQKFCEARDWDQFHNPKDLAIGISTEANELLDIFRFKSEEQMKTIMEEETKKTAVEDELADTLFFILRFAQMNGIDLSEVLGKKMKKNGERYTVELAKGKNEKIVEKR